MRNSIILFLFFTLISVLTKAQTFSCTSDYYCSLNLKDSIFRYSDNKTDSTDDISYAKSPESSSYGDVSYTGDCNGTQDYCSGNPSALIFQAYYPKKTAYTHYGECALPWIIMVHGGAFSDCATKNAPDIKFICQEFAERGFVAFDLEYRGGSLHSSASNYLYLKTAQQQLAVYRAVQDLRGAIRSICQMSDNGVFDNWFSINKDKMFIGGASSGAGIVLATAYLQTQAMINQSSPGISNVLGSIDADYYYANSTYTMPTIKGVFDMWGGFAMPGTITTSAQAFDFFSGNAYIAPVIAFHGDDDMVAPVWQRYENFPANGDNNSTSLCVSQTFSVTHTTVMGANDLLMIGTLALRDLVQTAGKKAEAYIDCSMGHGLDNVDGSTFHSDFGTGFNTERAVQVYMVQRAAIFFQSILSNTSIPGLSTFIKTPNTRYNTYSIGTGACTSADVVTSGKNCTNCNIRVIDCN